MATTASILQKLLRITLQAVHAAEIPYAIGGALAMEAHGLSRSTKDVDIFVKPDNAFALLRALRVLGLTVIPIFEPHHYAAYLPKNTDPEARIDILVPAGEPELSAIEWSETKSIFGIDAEVFPVDLLVFAKAYANRPKDELDLAMMMARGMFDQKHVSDLIRSVDPDGADEFDRLIKRITRKTDKRRTIKTRLPPRR